MHVQAAIEVLVSSSYFRRISQSEANAETVTDVDLGLDRMVGTALAIDGTQGRIGRVRVESCTFEECVHTMSPVATV